jgi:Trk K+ transport system NAD-binding subunit
MLHHDREEIRESLGGGDILRVRVPVPKHLVGKPANTLNVDGKILVAGVSRGGTGFLPTADSTLQEGDYLIVMMVKDGLELLDQQLEVPSEHH